MKANPNTDAIDVYKCVYFTSQIHNSTNGTRYIL